MPKAGINTSRRKWR